MHAGFRHLRQPVPPSGAYAEGMRADRHEKRKKGLEQKKDAKPENTFRKRIQFPHPTEPLIRLELMTYALRMRCSTN